MRTAKGRLISVIDLPTWEADYPNSILVLDELTYLPEAGDVLQMADRAVPVLEVLKHQTVHCLTWQKLPGRGSIYVLVGAPARDLRAFERHPNQLWVTWAPKGELPWHFASDDLPTFTKLNEDWNAEPNDPALNLEQRGKTLLAIMKPNPYLYPKYKGVRELTICFDGCGKYRVTPINDHGWHSGQCRFSGLAPSWGEFYEVSGDTRDEMEPTPWIEMEGAGTRHFHFYLRDVTLEVKAQDWSMRS